MPIVSLNGPEAVRTRKANEFATWGVRTQENRVEPLARPAFDVPFRLEPGEKIFTIGSCFARNVEGELLRRGFKIPMRDLFKSAEFKGLDAEIVNNFGTPSIYNELAWAFGETEFDESEAFVELGPDKYVDLHMVNSVRPAPLAMVRARRTGLHSASRTLSSCRVLVMTLGLVELWWDRQSNSYLNTGPMPTVLKRWPDRFELHVLSFAECHDYLRRALDIVFRHGRDDLKVILTVSPVPMMATHRRTDVITANSYSKSVLRAVAEQIVTADDRICYFPSYETVTLSDRRIAWMDDLVHVTREMVEFNVQRMVDAFTGQADGADPALLSADELPRESAAALILAEQARRARSAHDEAFFAEHADAARTSPAFAIEYARFLHDRGEFDKVVATLAEDERTEAVLLRGQALFRMGDRPGAIAAARSVCASGVKGAAHWRLLLDALVEDKAIDAIVAAEADWLKAAPGNHFTVLLHSGRALKQAGALELARDRLREVAEGPRANGLALIEYASCQIDLGDYAAALRTLDQEGGENNWQAKRMSALRRQAKSKLEAA